MVNRIHQTLITNETSQGASLQVIQLFQNFVDRISDFQKLCIGNYLGLFRGNRIGKGKDWLSQWLQHFFSLKSY